MAPQTTTLTVTAVAPLLERRQSIRRESLRDFGGVALAVAAGALVWVAFLSLVRLPM